MSDPTGAQTRLWAVRMIQKAVAKARQLGEERWPGDDPIVSDFGAAAGLDPDEGFTAVVTYPGRLVVVNLSPIGYRSLVVGDAQELQVEERRIPGGCFFVFSMADEAISMAIPDFADHTADDLRTWIAANAPS